MARKNFLHLRPAPVLRIATYAVLVAACSDSSAGPGTPGQARVSIQTVGGDPDLNGYVLIVDGRKRYSLAPVQDLFINSLSPGEHTFRLDDVDGNCAVTGQNPRTIGVQSGGSLAVSFEVQCVATALAVTVRASGTDIPQNYEIALPGRTPLNIAANSTLTIGRLVPNHYRVTLAVPGEHCNVLGGPAQDVAVPARQTVAVTFEVVCAPVVRPEKIAFVFDTVIGYARPWIALMNPDGTGRVRIGPGHGPAWSPDGTRLLFSQADCIDFFYYGWPCSGSLVEFDPETSNTASLAEGSGGFEPAWSPSGQEVAFVKCCAEASRSTLPNTLWVLDLTTRTTQHIPTSFARHVTRPTWSPNGDRIAFQCTHESNRSDVCVMTRNGESLEIITRTFAGSFAMPAWSPDGERLAVVHNDRVAILHMGTGSLTTLTTGVQPAWSPDGTQLVFARFDGIFAIHADGSNLRRMTQGNHHAPVWRP